MAALPIRSALTFDKDAFTKVNQGPNRAENIRMAADILSTGNQGPTLCDIDSLRKVMGGSGPLQRRERPARSAPGRKQDQSSQVIHGADTSSLDAYAQQVAALNNQVLQAPAMHKKPTAQSDGLGKKSKPTGQQNTKGMRENPWGLPTRYPGHARGTIIDNLSNTSYKKSTQKGNDTLRKNGKESTVQAVHASHELRSKFGPRKPSQQQDSTALQDYQMQLLLLEQQNKKRLQMARQEQDNMQQQSGSVTPQTKSSQQNTNDGGTPNHGEDDPNSRASDASGHKNLGTKYTISEDDTVPEMERQKRRLIALQHPPQAVPAAPRDWRP